MKLTQPLCQSINHAEQFSTVSHYTFARFLLYLTAFRALTLRVPGETRRSDEGLSIKTTALLDLLDPQLVKY